MRQVRTCNFPNTTNISTLTVPYSSRQYFQILHEIFRSSGSLPPPLSDFLMNGYFDKFFPVRKKIGKGSFGCVYKVEHYLAGIRLAEYAVKIVPVGEFNWLRRALNEVRLLEELSISPHPFVLSYKHCWIEDWQTATFGPKVPCLFILMEYSPLGSLDKLLEPKNMREGDVRKLTDDEMWQIFCSIAIALRHLHTNGIIHRDLKLSNVLAFDDDHYPPLKLRLALCDFGTATSTNSPEEKRTGATGTIETMAPELLRTNHDGDYLFRHSTASDVWSLGVILFTLYTRKSPFGSDRGEELLRHFTTVDNLIEELKIKVDLNSLQWKWIKAFMNVKPGRRARLDDFLQDPLIHQKIKKFGFGGLLDKTQFSHVVVTSPSMDEFTHSMPFALMHDNGNEADSQHEAQANHNTDSIGLCDNDIFPPQNNLDEHNTITAQSAADAFSAAVLAANRQQMENRIQQQLKEQNEAKLKEETEKNHFHFAQFSSFIYLFLGCASLSLDIDNPVLCLIFMFIHGLLLASISLLSQRFPNIPLLIPIIILIELILDISSCNVFLFLLILALSLDISQS